MLEVALALVVGEPPDGGPADDEIAGEDDR
jgi:hypothetical protein